MLKRHFSIPILLAVFHDLVLLPLSQTNKSGSSMLQTCAQTQPEALEWRPEISFCHGLLIAKKRISWLSTPCTVSLPVHRKAYLNATPSARGEELQPTPLGQVIDHRFLGISPLVGKQRSVIYQMIYACLSLGVVFPSVVSSVVDFDEQAPATFNLAGVARHRSVAQPRILGKHQSQVLKKWPGF